MKFETQIAIPDRQLGRRRAYRYPIREMLVGDSYLITDGISQSSLGAMLTKIRQQTGKRFTQRMVDGGIRVWRVE